MHQKLGIWTLAGLVTALIILSGQPVGAQEDCAAVSEDLHRLAGGVKAEIRGRDIKAGEAFEFVWRAADRFPRTTPAYLVLAIPSEVRFEAKAEQASQTADGRVRPLLPGLMAFPRAAKAPFGMKFGLRMARAVIPLYQAGSRLAGSISVRMFNAGKYQVEAAVFVIDKCGARKLSGDFVREINVVPNAPEIVVQDPYDIAVPKRTLISNSRRYLAQVFDGRYRVFDIATGAKFVDRAGHNPNFSPTSRFIVADIGDADGRTLEVIDLVSREVIFTPEGPFVGWVNGDAFMIDGAHSFGSLSVRPSLISRAGTEIVKIDAEGGFLTQEWRDGLSLSHPGACHACASWRDSHMMLDTNRGVVIFHGESAATYELATGYSSSPAGVYDANSEMRPGWHASGPIAFSQVYDPPAGSNNKDDKAGILLRRLLVTHHEVDPKEQVPHVAALNFDAVIRGDWRVMAREAGQAQNSTNKHRRLLATLAHFDVQTASRAERKAANFSNSPIGMFSSERDIKDVIEPRTAPYRKLLLQEVPALAPHLFPHGEDLGRDYFPHQGNWPNANIDLNRHLVGLWRWKISGRPLWLMQLLTIEGSGGFGFGTVLLLDGTKDAKTPIINMSEALPGFWKGEYAGPVQLKPQIFLDRYLVIASVVSKTIAVYDIASGRMLTLVKNAPQADLIDEVLLSADARHVIQVNSDGQFFLHETATGATALSGRNVDGEIILYTLEGYYWSSYEGAHFIQLRFPGLPRLFPFLQFASVLNRPDLVKARLANAITPGQSLPTKLTKPPAPALAPPPALEVRLLKSPAAIREDRVFIAAHSSTGLAHLRLYQDGQLVHDQEIKGPLFRGEIAIPHAPHARFLTVIATDTAGFLSTPQALRLKPGPEGTNRLYAVLTGIDIYADSRINLKYAKSDAQRLARALTASGKRYYSAQRQTQLLNGDATLDAIIAALQEAVSEARAEDTILFSFAGHGVQNTDGRYYLTPAGFRLDSVAATGLSWSRIASILVRSKARVVIVLDACHSGLSGTEGFTTNDDAVNALLSGTHAPMLVLAASKGREVAHEDPKWGGGVFTYALAEVLRGGFPYDLNGNKTLEISELYRGLKVVTSRETRGHQTPWLARQDLIGDFALF